MKKAGLPYYFLLSFFIVSVALSCPAQSSLQCSPAGTSRETPLIGFNAIGYLYPNGNWLNQGFTDSATLLRPGLLRYPGGTNANYWDWQTGWFLPAFPRPYPVYIPPSVFKTALQATNSQGLYVLNYRNSNIQYQMKLLRHLDSLGIRAKFVEIGNEHNLVNSGDPNQYVDPVTYGTDCKVWCDSIKTAFPAIKICLVGGSPGSINTWHQPILNQNPAFDAFAWHVYINANNTELVFNVNRALASAFSNMAFRFTQSNFPATKDIWATEYNLWETQSAPGGSSIPVIANTWTHTLYVTAMNHFMLTRPQIKMMLNHALSSVDDYHAAINRNNLRITAGGIAMKLLCDVARGMDSTQQISFNPNPTITYGSTVFDKCIGWKFKNSAAANGFICNFSPNVFKLSLAGVFSNTMQFQEYFADTALVVNGLSVLNQYTGVSTDTITIYPFAILQIYSGLQTATPDLPVLSNTALLIYPNPAQRTLTLRVTHLLLHAGVAVYNMAGQQVLTMQNVSGNEIRLETGGLAGGVYIIKINNGRELLTAKFIRD